MAGTSSQKTPRVRVLDTEEKMRLITHLSAGVFNAVKFVVLYVLVDNLLVWSRVKLKRAVYVADLIHGVPVRIVSITDNNGRNNVVDIYYSLKAILVRWMPVSTSEAGAKPSLLRKNIFRAFSLGVARIAPLFILFLVFLLDLGTGDVKKCKHKNVQFDSAEDELDVFAGSLKCAHIREGESRRTGDIVSFRVEYVETVFHEKSFYCGCTSSTESLCMSSFNNEPSKAPNAVVWNTSVFLSSNLTERSRSNFEMLQQVRDEFAFPRKVPWRILPVEDADTLREFFISCFTFSDESRTCAACVREYAFGLSI